MQQMQDGSFAPQTQDQTQTQDGYAYPQDQSGDYYWPYSADSRREGTEGRGGDAAPALGACVHFRSLLFAQASPAPR